MPEKEQDDSEEEEEGWEEEEEARARERLGTHWARKRLVPPGRVSAWAAWARERSGDLAARAAGLRSVYP